MDLLDRYLEELYDDALMNNYAIRPSPIHGNGVFSKQRFKKGDFINTHFEPKLKITEFGAHLNHCPDANGHSVQDAEITLDYTSNLALEQPQKGWK